MFKRLTIKVLFRLLRIRIGEFVDTERVKKWVGAQYPEKGFQDYIFRRNMAILQQMGEGMSERDYWIALGQRIELGKLMTEAKNNWTDQESELTRRRIADQKRRAEREKK